MTVKEPKLLRVGELAKAVGKTVRAIHLYEELALLEPVSRSAGGYRLYTTSAVERVSWIGKLQDMGFSLAEIQAFLRDWQDAQNGPDGMARIRAVFEAKRAETKKTIERLSALERDLEASLEYLQTCGGCAPTHVVTDCAECAEPGHDPKTTPDLVAGLARPHAASHTAKDQKDFHVPVGSLTDVHRS